MESNHKLERALLKSPHSADDDLDLEDATSKISAAALAHLISPRHQSDQRQTVKFNSEEIATGALSKNALQDLLSRDRGQPPPSNQEVATTELNKAELFQIIEADDHQRVIEASPTRQVQAVQQRPDPLQLATEKLDVNAISAMLALHDKTKAAAQPPHDDPEEEAAHKTTPQALFESPWASNAGESLEEIYIEPEPLLETDDDDILSSAPSLDEESLLPPTHQTRPPKLESVNIIPEAFTAPTPLQPKDGFPQPAPRAQPETLTIRSAPPAPSPTPASKPVAPPRAAQAAPSKAKLILMIVLAALLGGISAAGLVIALLH